MPVYLREWRLTRRLQQKELAARTGLSVQTISNVERRRSGAPDTVARLALALGCSEIDLRSLPGAEKIDVARVVKQGTAAELRQLGEIFVAVSDVMEKFPERVPLVVLAAERCAGLRRK
jgi:transcriptional regulator with XRE-family HTH domain